MTASGERQNGWRWELASALAGTAACVLLAVPIIRFINGMPDGWIVSAANWMAKFVGKSHALTALEVLLMAPVIALVVGVLWAVQRLVDALFRRNA